VLQRAGEGHRFPHIFGWGPNGMLDLADHAVGPPVTPGAYAILHAQEAAKTVLKI
jgi:hypothetical protein